MIELTSLDYARPRKISISAESIEAVIEDDDSSAIVFVDSGRMFAVQESREEVLIKIEEVK